MIYPIMILVITNERDRLFMQCLYEDYHKLMFAVAWDVLKKRDYVEDIVSCACISLIANVDTLQRLDVPALKSYIAETVKNKCYDHLRSEQTQLRHYQQDIDMDIENKLRSDTQIDEGVLREAEIEELKRAMLVLMRKNEREYRVIQMSYYQGLKDAEIAEIMGISPVTVRVCRAQARKRLAQIVSDREKSHEYFDY